MVISNQLVRRGPRAFTAHRGSASCSDRKALTCTLFRVFYWWRGVIPTAHYSPCSPRLKTSRPVQRLETSLDQFLLLIAGRNNLQTKRWRAVDQTPALAGRQLQRVLNSCSVLQQFD